LFNNPKRNLSRKRTSARSKDEVTMVKGLYCPMLSAAEIAAIKKDIADLKKAYEGCADSGIRQLIQEWILDAEKNLATEKKSK